MKTERTELRLTPEHLKRLEEMAERKQVSRSEVIRRLIDKAYRRPRQ